MLTISAVEARQPELTDLLDLPLTELSELSVSAPSHLKNSVHINHSTTSTTSSHFLVYGARSTPAVINHMPGVVSLPPFVRRQPISIRGYTTSLSNPSLSTLFP